MTDISAVINESAPKWRIQVSKLFRTYGTVIIFVLLVVFASSQSNAFLSEGNVMNILLQISGIGLMSVGMLLVILTAGIDLSVGSIAALGSVASALFFKTIIQFYYCNPVGDRHRRSLRGLISGVLHCLLSSSSLRNYPRDDDPRRAVMHLSWQMGEPYHGEHKGAENARPISAVSFTIGIPNPAIVIVSPPFWVALIVLNFTRFGRFGEGNWLKQKEAVGGCLGFRSHSHVLTGLCHFRVLLPRLQEF